MLVGFRINLTRPSLFSVYEYVVLVLLETLYDRKPKIIVVKHKNLLLGENCDSGSKVSSSS